MLGQLAESPGTTRLSVYEAQRRSNAFIVECSHPSRGNNVRGRQIESDDLNEQQLRKLLRCQYDARSIRGHLFHELVEEPTHRRGFGRPGIDVNDRWQHVCENAAAVRIQGHVSADGEEVFAI